MMDYCVEQCQCNFFIKASSCKLALQALCSAMEGYDWFKLDNARDLKSAIHQFNWIITSDPSGNVVDIEKETETLGEDKKMLKAIAPFVQEGSYIEMIGQDYLIWRWVFDGTSCNEITPTFIW